MIKDLISILIVNWNQGEFLNTCLKSISDNDYKNIEIIVIDNASTDGSQKILRKLKNFKNLTYIESKINLGFSGGNNLALSKSKGEYVLLLNSDTKLGKKTLSKLVKFLKIHKKAAVVQPKLVFMSDNNKLDNVGAYLTRTGIPYYFGLYKKANDPKYNVDIRVYSCKGACMLIRRDVIEKVGFLDEYMFAYYEESDFCHRVWLGGFECWYMGSDTVEHFVGSTYEKRDNITTVYKGHRNRIRSFIKNFEVHTLIWLLPTHIIFLIGVFFVEVLRGRPKIGLAVMRAIYTNISNINETLSQRHIVQINSRKVKDKQISKYIFREPRLSYYRYVGGGLEKYED